MARRKTPDNETEEDKYNRQIKENISNGPDRSAKVSWKRKRKNIEDLVEQITPLEEEILALMAKKQPIIDEISEIRKTMIHECIHSFEYLDVKKDHVLCKFCNTKIRLNNAAKEAKDV